MNLPMSVEPEFYKDDLTKRIFPMRFRRIGNPYAFLNDVGIIPVLEYIYKGNLLIDVAEAVNVSYTVLSAWVEQEGHGPAIEEAEQISAEGYLAEGHRRLREAETAFELSKAKEMVKQAQFMASKKNKRRYGTSEVGQQGAGVSYVFNIGGDISAPAMKTVEHILHQTLPEDTAPVTLALDFNDSTPIGAIDFGLSLAELDKPDQIRRNEAMRKKLVDMSHLAATPDEPDIGPFYDGQEPTDGS